MATRKGTNIISGNYAAPHILHALFIYVLAYLKKMKARTKPYFAFIF